MKEQLTINTSGDMLPLLKEVEEEYAIGNDEHRIEYVCDYYTRFIVSRETF